MLFKAFLVSSIFLRKNDKNLDCAGIFLFKQHTLALLLLWGWRWLDGWFDWWGWRVLARLDDAGGDEGVGEGGGGVAGVMLPVVVTFEAHDVADAANRHHGILLAHALRRLVDPCRLHLHRSNAARGPQPVRQDGIAADQTIAGCNGTGQEFRRTLAELLLAKMPEHNLFDLLAPRLVNIFVEETLYILLGQQQRRARHSDRCLAVPVGHLLMVEIEIGGNLAHMRMHASGDVKGRLLTLDSAEIEIVDMRRDDDVAQREVVIRHAAANPHHQQDLRVQVVDHARGKVL